MESSPKAQGDTKLEDLPEDVVCRILSCLPMRDVARVSPSCSAFQRAWARYPRLTFDEDTLGLPRPPRYILLTPQQDAERVDPMPQLREELANSFVRHVDAIIGSRRRRHDAASLDALVVKFAYLRERDVPCVDRWVSFALASTTTRLLRLDFQPNIRYNSDGLEYDLPCSLLSAGTPAAAALEHLYLRHGSLRLLSDVSPGLTNLQTLVLSRSRVSSEDLDRLLFSCGLKLRSLKLNWCKDVAYLKVPPALRILVLKNCWSMTRIDGVCGSSIESLRCDGGHLPAILLHGWTSTSQPAAKVTSASFDLEFLPGPAGARYPGGDHDDSSWLQLLSLARLMPGLESLTLNLVRYVNIDMLSSSTHCCTGKYRFSHLKRADIRMYMSGEQDDFLFLYLLLDAAPALETLSLDLRRWAALRFEGSRHILDQTTAAAGSFRKDSAGFPRHSLKAVDMFGFSADIASLELALYILDNAHVLRRMSLEPMWNSFGDAEESNRLIREAITKYISPAVPSDSGILLDVK